MSGFLPKVEKWRSPRLRSKMWPKIARTYFCYRQFNQFVQWSHQTVELELYMLQILCLHSEQAKILQIISRYRNVILDFDVIAD